MRRSVRKGQPERTFEQLLDAEQGRDQRERKLARALGTSAVTAPAISNTAPAEKLASAEKHISAHPLLMEKAGPTQSASFFRKPRRPVAALAFRADPARLLPPEMNPPPRWSIA